MTFTEMLPTGTYRASRVYRHGGIEHRDGDAPTCFAYLTETVKLREFDAAMLIAEADREGRKTLPMHCHNGGEFDVLVEALREPVVNHVRVGVRVASRRIMGDRGTPGRALCGGELSDKDISLPEAKRDCKDGWKWLRCPKCRELVEKEMGR